MNDWKPCWKWIYCEDCISSYGLEFSEDGNLYIKKFMCPFCGGFRLTEKTVEADGVIPIISWGKKDFEI